MAFRTVLCIAAAVAVTVTAQPSGACAADPSPYKNETACYTAGCEWCFCKAVPSSCTSYAQATHLPSGVFQCANSSAGPIDGSGCDAPSTEDACTSVGCAWCASKAVPSRCLPYDLAQKLPPGAFVCSLAPA